MKIALVSPVMVEVPPKTYGGTQLMIYELAMGLAKRGHKITLFCSAGSNVPHKNITIVKSSPYPTIDRSSENRYWEARELLTVLSRQNEFDIIHLFYEPIVCEFLIEEKMINILSLFHKPVISSFRNLTSIPGNIEYYKKNVENLKNITKIFLSKKQQSYLPFLGKSKVIYNGLDVSRYRFENKKDDYLIFLGRITKGKGIIEAIETAKKTNNKLIIAAKICSGDKDFYEKSVKRLIDGEQIKYVGEVNFSEKINYLSRAKAMLFPISWEEPFGLVVAESMACGTPVISFNCGAMPELIKHGFDGFIAQDTKEMIEFAKIIDKIKPENCRKSIEKKFTQTRMTDEYEKIYLKMVN